MISGEPMSSAVASSRFIDVVASGPYHLGNGYRSNNGFGISSNNRGEERYPFPHELRNSYRNLERTIDRSEQIPLYQQLTATSLMPVPTASFCHYSNTSASTEAAPTQRSARGLERLSFDSMSSGIVEADSGSRERSYSWPSQPCPAVETAALYSSSNACTWPTSRLMPTSSSIGCTDVDSMGYYAERPHQQQTGNSADMSTTVWARKTGWTIPPSASVRRLNGQTRTTTFPPAAGTDSRPASSVGSVVGASRRNAWGNLSYAELITQAIESSPEKRLTLSQVYDWMVLNVPYFKDKGDSYSSAGWKNSIRHNLSLHSQFARVPNDTAGKSSWWVVNHEARLLKSSRRRATSTDTRTTEKRKGRTKKKVDGTNKSAIEAADTTMEVDSTTSTLPVTDYDSIHHDNHRFSTATAVAISGHVSVGVGVSGSGITVSNSNLSGRSQFDAFNTTRPRSRSSCSQLSPIDDNNSCGGDGTAASRDSVQQLSPISTSFDWSRGVGTGSRNGSGYPNGMYGFGHMEDRLMVPTAFNCEPIGDGVHYNHTLAGIGSERTLSESLADMLVTGGLGNNGISSSSSSSSVVVGSNGLNRQVRHRHSDSQYSLASSESISEGLVTSYPSTSKTSAAVDWLTGKGQSVAGCYSPAVLPDRFDCQGRYDDDGFGNLEKKKWTNVARQQHSSDVLTTCRSVEHVTRGLEESAVYSHAVATVAGSLRRCSDSILTSGRLHPYVSGYHNNDVTKHRDFDASGSAPTSSVRKQKAPSLWSDNLYYQSTASTCRQGADSRGLMVSNDKRMPVGVSVTHGQHGQAKSPRYEAECTDAFLQKSYVICKRSSASTAHDIPGVPQAYQSESFRNRMNQIGTQEPPHQQQTAKQTDHFSNHHHMTLPPNINHTVSLSTTSESLAGITSSNEPEVSWSRANSKKSDVITPYDHVTCRDQQAPSSMKPQSTSVCDRVSSVNEYMEKMISGISDGKTYDIKKTASSTIDVHRQLISFEDSINYDYYRSGNVTAK